MESDLTTTYIRMPTCIADLAHAHEWSVNVGLWEHAFRTLFWNILRKHGDVAGLHFFLCKMTGHF